MSQEREAAHHTVLSLRVTGGFLSGVALEFGAGLNCIIGGRGTGKTTALEFLRFAFGLIPDARANPGRARSMESLVKTNLSGGRVVVEVKTRDGLKYRAERSPGEAARVFNESGSAVPVSLDGDRIFGVDVFSQNEIEEIALSPPAQLDLLDRFIDGDAQLVERELRDLHEQLLQTSRELRRLDGEIDDLRASASEHPVLEERMKALAPLEGPGAEVLKAAQANKGVRAREALLPDRLNKATARAVDDVAGAHRAFAATVDAQLEAEFRNGVNNGVFAPLEEDARTFVRVLDQAATLTREAGVRLTERLRVHQQVLAQLHAEQDAVYSKLMASSQEQGGRLAERAQAEERLAAALDAAKQAEAKRTERAAVAERRSKLLEKMSELRDRRFAARKRVAEDLTSRLQGTIRVSVTQAADVARYAELLAEALKGSGLKQGVAADRLAEALLPGELSDVVQTNDTAAIIRAGFDEPRAKKIVDALRADGRIYDLEVVELEDVPRIELLDGDQYKDSPNLSTGQRCTTILPILLVQSERPLLVDQPEDNLDNKFIYDTIVKALHSAKGKRQVIFVTHNPNIPVLGDAERVFVLESDGRRATVTRVGSVDQCKDDVETILEGGREAFRQRKVRYGH